MSFYNQGTPISTMTDNLIMELILKHARGSVLSREECRILHEWEEASPDNKVLLESFGDQEWLEERLKEMEAVPSRRMWGSIRQRIGVREEAPVKKSVPLYHIMGSLAIVALLVVLLINPRLLQQVFSRAETVQPPSTTVIAEVSVSDYRRTGAVDIVLPDGSKIKLSYASRLCYPERFAGPTREVYLTGEASFDIAKSNHPFIVHAGQATVQVLGTFFNVKAYQGEPDAVTLISGALKVSDSAGRMARVMKPAERAVVGDGAVDVVACPHPEASLSWSDKTPVFHFDNTDLHTVVRELARWYELDMIDSLPVRGTPISGELKMQDSLRDDDLTLINYTETRFAHVERHGRRLILSGPVMH